MQNQHVCPWWLGYTFLIPLRKWQHHPDKILNSLIQPGMRVMDFGSAMGYFSIPLAQKAGNTGKVYCVDIQEKMLNQLRKRAAKYKVHHIIETLRPGYNYHPSALSNSLDFILLFMVAHEVPDKKTMFTDFYTMLKPGGKILFFEPKGHVKKEDFTESLQIAQKAGLIISTEKPLINGLAVFLTK